MKIYCCTCEKDMEALLVPAKEIFGTKANNLNGGYWRCVKCNSYCGTHNKGRKVLSPLGSMAGPEIRNARIRIHRILDPLWMRKNAKLTRKKVYKMLSRAIGRDYHTAELRTLEECSFIYFCCLSIYKYGFIDKKLIEEMLEKA